MMVANVKTISTSSAQPAAMSAPSLDPTSPLLFVVNAASGAFDVGAKRAVIESALAARGRKGELLICRPAELSEVAAQAAAAAAATNTAVIAVGGDGSLNAVAQAAHSAGCPMGVIPYGTFNYFARTHGIPTDPLAAARMLLEARPLPVQVAAINDRLFLVNASLGIYTSCCKTARHTRRALAAAAGLRSWRPVPRCYGRNVGCGCTSRWAGRSATCKP